MGGPPPINTAAQGYPPGHPNALPQQQGGPPGYAQGPPGYGAGGGGPSLAAQQYQNRNNAVEVEGAGRSKAQLIVGIDFVSLLFCSLSSLVWLVLEELGIAGGDVIVRERRRDKMG